MMGVWDIAHSTPLEIAAEMGIPLCLLVVGAWIVAFVILARGAIRRRREAVIPIAVLSVCLIAVIHSMVDFSLQIPGYMIVAFALLGIGLSQSLVEPMAVERERSENTEPGEAETEESGDTETPHEPRRRRRRR
jgi:O-antigen ligase